MDTLPQVNIAAKYEHFQYGYNLFVAGQPIKICTNVEQQRGWRSAKRGMEAVAMMEAAFSMGIDADYAIAGGW